MNRRLKTFVVEDFRALDAQLAAGVITQDEYDSIFSEARLHGLMNTEDGRRIGKIMPFAVGGSDTGAILGISKYTSKRKLQRQKLGLWNQKVSPDQQFIFDFGHLFEHGTGMMNVKLLSERTGRDLSFEPCPFGYLNEAWPHVLAHPDGFIKDRKTGELFLAEIKTTSAFSGNWTDYFKQGKIPEEYFAQVQAYLEILGLKKGYLLAWNAARSVFGFTQIEVDLDEDFAVDVLDACERFVEDTENGHMYGAEDIESLKLLSDEAAELYGAEDSSLGYVTLGSEKEDLFRELDRIQEERAMCDARLKPFKDALDAAEKAYKDAAGDDLKVLSRLDRKEAEKMASLYDDIGCAKGGIFETEDATYRVDVSRGYSLDSSVKSYAESTFPAAWDAITKRKPTIKASYRKILKEDAGA